ncbi:MAG TPA: AtpZ/AtpI family protein [Candidatus Acidoferrales bacterium]|nr:AtpZ/AtpI family protein [Candidatus Acidoferrales bacterium]
MKKKQTLGESLGEAYRQLAPFMGLGTELAASVAGMLLIGFFLDKHFNTYPWLLLTGAAAGLIGGFFNFIREVQKLSKSDTKRKG